MFKHILLPTDGSPVGNKAVKAGIELAQALGARVSAYYALEELHPVYMQGYAFDAKSIIEIDRGASKAAQRLVDPIGRMAKAAGVPFNAVVTKTNAPYEGIIQAAKKYKCDVIFMASHGRRGFSGWLIGSVTQKVLAHSRIPVVVYR